MKMQPINSIKKFVVLSFVFFLFLGYVLLNAQTLNPPYPRLGIFTFSGQTEACVDIFKYFDVVASVKNSNMARLYKEQNPNKILLMTSGNLCDWSRGTIEWPDEWYYLDKDGQKFDVSNNLKMYMMNITKLCPKVDMGEGYGPETWVEHQVRLLGEIIEPNYEGFFYDWWWSQPWGHNKFYGDLDRNGVADASEWGVDSVVTLWWKGLLDFHDKMYQVPGVNIQVVQIGSPGVWPYVNGACWEDWPAYIGPYHLWRRNYNDSKTVSDKAPQIIIMDGAHSYFNNRFPVVPYKNNYKAVRFNLGNCLLTRAYFYVDEGNFIAHHGNVHIYDEFEAKGQLGYPRTDMIEVAGKPRAATAYADYVVVRFFDNGVSVVNATGLEQTITASELAAMDPLAGSKYYRFLGGQDPEFNNGEEVTNANPIVLWGDVIQTSRPELEVFGDGAMLFRTKKTLITPIVVDNNENNQTSPGSDPAQYQGGWVFSSDGGKFYAVYTGRNYGPFQPNGFAWSPPGSGENVATYIPTIGVAGMYEILEWHGYRGSSPTNYQLASNVPAKITFGSGQDTTVVINQTTNFGKWNSLGVYYFPKGTSSDVRITNQANGIVISDAIEFVYRGPSEQYDATAPVPPENLRVIQLD